MVVTSIFCVCWLPASSPFPIMLCTLSNLIKKKILIHAACLLSANAFYLDVCKILLFGKELKKKSLCNNFIGIIFLDLPVKSLPNDKILDLSKLRAFADDNLNANYKLKFGLGRVQNIVGKGENAGNQHFLLFPQCFQTASSLGFFRRVLKSQDCVGKS